MSAELERTNGQQLALAGNVTPVGIEFPEDMAFEDWEATGRTLKLMDSALQFALGDWLAFGERKYGEMYSQAESDTGLDYSTLTNYKYVAESVPHSVRDAELTWSHHRAVAALDPPAQKVLLREAKTAGWTKAQLEREAKAEKTGGEVVEPETCPSCGRVLPGGNK